MKIKSIEEVNKKQDIFCVEVDHPEHEIVLECKSHNKYRIQNCNFGLIYGLHWTTFVTMMTSSKQSNMTADEAKTYYDKFFDSYKGIATMIDTAKNTFMYGTDKEITRWVRYKNGSLHKLEKTVPFFHVVQTLLGRKLAVDGERKMMNYPVQGSGADAIKLAICKMDYQIRTSNSTQKTINLVHDDTIAESKLNDFDDNSKMFRGALEWAVNFVLKHLFYTPVNQDFCILSLLGEEIFLEEAFTLEDIDIKLVEKIQELIDKIKKSDDSKEKTDLTIEANRVHKLLEKFRNRVQIIKSEETQINTDNTLIVK